MGLQLTGPPRGNQHRSDLWTAALAGVLVGGVMGAALMWAQDDDPVTVREPLPAEIAAAMVVNAAVVEMRGYDSNGNAGVFLYDCRNVEGDIVEGEPTLVCTQREEG